MEHFIEKVGELIFCIPIISVTSAIGTSEARLWIVVIHRTGIKSKS